METPRIQSQTFCLSLASLALLAENQDEVKISDVTLLLFIAVALKSRNASPSMCCHPVTSPILPFKKVILYAFLNIKGTDIHCFKVFAV